ncbi:MAG: glutamate racemase [Eubacteriales bacterium]|nr:glutamate racemase [Eubacteriales bacterium]
MNSNQKIAVFDSGLGGLSVLKHLLNALPNEDYIYMADSLNAPYGIKSPEEVLELTEKAFDTLFFQDIKILVVACNTASTQYNEIGHKEKYKNKLIFTIHPSIQGPLNDNRTSNILLMATKITLQSNYVKNMLQSNKTEKKIETLAAGDIVPFVEKNNTNSSEFDHMLHNLLLKYKNIDSVILGCTHFPFVKEQINNELMKNNNNKEIIFFDNAIHLTKSIINTLKEKNILFTNKRSIHSVDIIDTLNDKTRLPIYKKLVDNTNFNYNFI